MLVSSSFRRFLLLAAMPLLVAVLLIAQPRDAKGAGSSILLLGPNQNIYGEFTKLNCKEVKGDHGNKRWVASGKIDGWKLDIALNKFNGYKKYRMTYGDTDAQIQLKSSGGTVYYTAIYGPEGQNAGFMNFAKDKKGKPDKTKFEISTVAYGAGGYTFAVYGAAKCVYPKKGKGK